MKDAAKLKTITIAKITIPIMKYILFFAYFSWYIGWLLWETYNNFIGD